MGRASARPMTGFATKQSMLPCGAMDCFASLAMTIKPRRPGLKAGTPPSLSKHECDVRVTARQLNFILCRAQPRMAEYRHHFRSRGDRFGHEGARREAAISTLHQHPGFALSAERNITLLDPASWDDNNNSYFLLLYREKKNLQSVLALCFTPAFETYHHWRLFAEGSSGARISFNQEGLLKAVKKQVGVTARSVRYLTLPDIRA